MAQGKVLVSWDALVFRSEAIRTLGKRADSRQDLKMLRFVSESIWTLSWSCRRVPRLYGGLSDLDKRACG